MNEITLKGYKYSFYTYTVYSFILLSLFILSFCRNISGCTRVSFMPAIAVAFNIYDDCTFELWYRVKHILSENVRRDRTVKAVVSINFLNMLILNCLNMFYLMKYTRLNLLIYKFNMLERFDFYYMLVLVVLDLHSFIKSVKRLAYYVKN